MMPRMMTWAEVDQLQAKRGRDPYTGYAQYAYPGSYTVAGSYGRSCSYWRDPDEEEYSRYWNAAYGAMNATAEENSVSYQETEVIWLVEAEDGTCNPPPIAFPTMGRLTTEVQAVTREAVTKVSVGPTLLNFAGDGDGDGDGDRRLAAKLKEKEKAESKTSCFRFGEERKDGYGVGHQTELGKDTYGLKIPTDVEAQVGEYTEEKLLELQRNTKTVGAPKPVIDNMTAEPDVVLKGLLKPMEEPKAEVKIRGQSELKERKVEETRVEYDAEKRLGLIGIGTGVDSGGFTHISDGAMDEVKSVRQEVEEKVARLTQQLQEAEEVISKLKAAGEVRETTYFDAVSRLQLCSPDQKSTRLSEQLDQEKAVVEALENQQLYSIQESEALRGEHAKLLEKLTRGEERERMLRRKVERLEHELIKEQEVRELEQAYAVLEEGDEAERLVLEQKLGSAKRELEIAHGENLRHKEEESEKDLTRGEAESETALAITSMQAELAELKTEAEVADKELAAAKGSVSELTSELDSMRMMLGDVKDENLRAIEKYESALRVKDSEIDALRKDWEMNLIDYLAEGDQALNEASLEMEQIFCGYLPSTARSSRNSMNYSRANEKRKAVEQLKQQLQHAQELAKDTEGRVRVLGEAAFAMAAAQAPELAPQEVERLRAQAAEAMEILQGEVDSSRRRLEESERNATVMSVVMVWLSESVEAKEIAGSRARAELRATEVVIAEKERLLADLRNDQEADRSALRESEENARQLSGHLEEALRTAGEREAAAADLGSEVARLQSAVDALEAERKQLVEAKEKVESEASETCSAMNGLKEELAVTRSLLKDAEDKAGEAGAAYESLAIVKEEWEAEKAGLQSALLRLEKEKSTLEAEREAEKAGLESALLRLEKEKSTLEAEREASRVELADVQARCEKLSNLVVEKEAEVAALEEEGKNLSCMSVAKEEEQLAAHAAEVELLRSEVRQKEALIKQAENEHLESVEASVARENERGREIAELREQSETLSGTSVKKEEELCESRRELGILQTELQRKQVLLEEAEMKLVQAVEASEQLRKEKDDRIAVLAEEGERMSCMSVKKEDGEVAEMRRKLESLQEEIRAKERSLEGVEQQLSESVQASRALGKEKEEAIWELKAEVNRLSGMYAENSGELSRLREELQSTEAKSESREVLLEESRGRVSQADAALEKLAGEKEAIQSELESRESLLLEFRARVDEADAALEAVAGEKAVVESRLESMTLESSVAASRLFEAEEAQSALQERIAVMEARIVEYEDREQSLTVEVEELSTARNMSEEDAIQLQNEVVELRRERDSLNLEVSTMDAQSAISERLQFIQSMCMDTDNRITSVQSEMEALTSAKETLETEVRSIEGRTAVLSLELGEREESLEVARKDLERVQTELMDVSGDNSAAREELAAAESKLQAAEESIDSMSKTIDELKKSRADKEDEHALLRERLEGARVSRMEAQEKLDALTVVMHEFSRSEESWRNERDRIASEMEAMRSRVAEKGAEAVALREEKRALEIRLQGVAGEKDAALASIASLENRGEKLEAGGKCAGKDASSGSDEVELAKARAALGGAEEKVKLLVDANATMAAEWEGERSRLNADKELLQLEISRLEKPLDSVSDEKRPSSEDGESGKDHLMDELKQVAKRSSADCEKLRCKLRERDNTILSVKLQLEEAMVHYKETEIEMEKTMREREDAISRMAELEAEVTNAEEEVMRRREQVETFELELEKVVVRVTDSEAEWRSERERLESERDKARAEAMEVECELREQLKRERDAARAEADEYAALRKRIAEARSTSERDKDCGQESRRDMEESVSLSLESIAAFALATEEVDLTRSHCEKEMETLAVDMKSLRADISSSFFEFPVVEIQEDVRSIVEAHRAEIASFARKVEGLESLVAESRSEISTLEAALENAREVVQKSLEEGQCVDSPNSEQAADLASACADLENTRVELEMSEAAVSELLAAVSERDGTLSVLESALKETRERLAEMEAERESNRREAEAAKLAVADVDQLRSQVVGLERQVAQKEELIKGLEYDINLLEETGAVEAESAAKSIGELQKELDEKREEVKRLRERTSTLELEVSEKLDASAAGNAASATEAAVENAKLRERVAGLEAQLVSLDALAKENESVVTSLKSELEAARSVMAESEAVAAKARQVTNVVRMCDLCLSLSLSRSLSLSPALMFTLI